LARRVAEGFSRAVEEQRALLRGDGRDLHAGEFGGFLDLLVGVERLPIDNRVGDDHHRAPVTRQHAPHVPQHVSDLVLPTLCRLVESQPAVLALGADLVLGQAAFLEPEPTQPVHVVLEVIVHPGVRRGGDDQIDRFVLDELDVARVSVRDVGARRALGHAGTEGVEPFAEFVGLVGEQLNGETAGQATRCLLARRITLGKGQLGQGRRDDQAQHARQFVLGQLLDAGHDAVQLEQDVDRITTPHLLVVALVRLGLVEASLFGHLRDVVGGLNQIADELFGRPAGLEPRQLDGQWVQVGAQRFAPQSPRFDDHGATTAKRIEHARAFLAQARDQARRGQRMKARWIAVKAVHVAHHLGLVGVDGQSFAQNLLLFGRAAVDEHLASHVAERTPFAARLGRRRKWSTSGRATACTTRTCRFGLGTRGAVGTLEWRDPLGRRLGLSGALLDGLLGGRSRHWG